jgi:hypothetical protein
MAVLLSLGSITGSKFYATAAIAERALTARQTLFAQWESRDPL